MPNRLTQPAAVTVATVLGVDGLLHLYWATGATLPATDSQTLSHAVLGSDVPFTPPVVIPLAMLLISAAGVVLARARLGRGHRWGKAFQLGTLAVGIGTSVRAIAGIAWMMGLNVDAPESSAFHWLNPFIYTPLCVLLAAASVIVARSTGEDLARVR